MRTDWKGEWEVPQVENGMLIGADRYDPQNRSDSLVNRMIYQLKELDRLRFLETLSPDEQEEIQTQREVIEMKLDEYFT